MWSGDKLRKQEHNVSTCSVRDEDGDMKDVLFVANILASLNSAHSTECEVSNDCSNTVVKEEGPSTLLTVFVNSCS